MRKALLRLQEEGNEEDAAYILMQRIFPSVFPTIFLRDGICHKDHAISELGIFGAYLRYVTHLSTTSLRFTDALLTNCNAWFMMDEERRENKNYETKRCFNCANNTNIGMQFLFHSITY